MTSVTSPRLGNVEVRLHCRDLTLKGEKGNLLSIDLCEHLSNVETPAPHLETSSASLTCNWKNLATLEVTQRLTHRSSFEMYDVTWTPHTKDIIAQDCIELGDSHWFGGPEMFEQHWPINAQQQTMMPYVTFVSVYVTLISDGNVKLIIYIVFLFRISSTSTVDVAASWSASGSTRQVLESTWRMTYLSTSASTKTTTGASSSKQTTTTPNTETSTENSHNSSKNLQKHLQHVTSSTPPL